MSQIKKRENTEKQPAQTEEEEQDRTRTLILECALRHFVEHGYSGTKLDEMASELSISKKTIYQYYRGKEDLFRSALRHQMDDINQKSQEIMEDDTLDAMGKLKNHALLGSRNAARLSGNFLRDLQSRFPELWDEINENRRRLLESHFSRILKDGIRSGVFRGNINVELLITIHRTLVETLINPKSMIDLPYTSQQLVEEILHMLFWGVLSDSARKNPDLLEAFGMTGSSGEKSVENSP